MTKCQLKKETNIRWKKRPLKTIPRDQGLNLNPQRMFGSGSGSSSTHGSEFSPMRKTLSDFFDLGCRDDVSNSKLYRFLYACGVPFNVLFSPYWHEMVQAINGAPK